MRQAHNGNLQKSRVLTSAEPFTQAVFIIDINVKIRHYSHHRDPAQLFNLPDAGRQQRNIPAEFIDNNASYPSSFLFGKQHDCAKDLGKYASPVDICRKKDRRIQHLRKSHVDDVVIFQVDLRRGAGSLDDDRIIFLLKPLPGFHDHRDQFLFFCEVSSGGHVFVDFSVHNDLRSGIAVWFQQDRVHIRFRSDPGSLRLHHLGTAHFQAVSCHEGIQCHVLGLKRCRMSAFTDEDSEDARSQEALARS